MVSDIAEGSTRRGGEPLTVICVEDNVDLLGLLKLALDSEQALHCTHAFADGGEFLQLLESGAQPPDVVVTDWSMPGVSGCSVVRHVRAAWPDARVIVFTAYSHRAVIDDACEAGAWGIVSKDDNFDVLLSAIREVDDGGLFYRC